MGVSRIVKQLLAVAMGCLPATLQPAAIPVPENLFMVATGFPCMARQPDLSVGFVIYVKGQVTLNGTTPLSTGTQVRHGDQITTANDGFVAIEVVGGNLVNILPATTFETCCKASVQGVAGETLYAVERPYLAGAVRG